MSWEDKSSNKSIIKAFLTSNQLLKYESTIHSIVFSSEKVNLLLSLTYMLRAALTYKPLMICADFSPDSDQTTLSLEEPLLWIKSDLFLSTPFINSFLWCSGTLWTQTVNYEDLNYMCFIINVKGFILYPCFGFSNVIFNASWVFHFLTKELNSLGPFLFFFSNHLLQINAICELYNQISICYKASFYMQIHFLLYSPTI